jgi:hypothetical protein
MHTASIGGSVFPGRRFDSFKQYDAFSAWPKLFSAPALKFLPGETSELIRDQPTISSLHRSNGEAQMSALGQKRTLKLSLRVFALCQKRKSRD